MKHSFSIYFSSRDFTSPILTRALITPQTLSWSAFGGPDRAELRMDGSVSVLLQLAGLLRCPVYIHDLATTPVWWGYVDQITIYFEGSKFTITLDKLFNKVKVTYSFISPDNRLADQLETSYAESAASQLEYGIREIVLHRLNLDDDFAEEFRDTFLSLHQWPSSVLSSLEKPGHCYAEVSCSGWFSTLAWQSYENLDGFYANYGPGPGSLKFGYPNFRLPSQKFTPGVDCDLKYAYFLIRKVAAPTSNIYARLYSDSGGSPNINLAASNTIAGSSLSPTNYQWSRFTFSPAYTLSAGTPYWITLNGATVNSTNYYSIRIDENACFHQDGHYAMYYGGGIWNLVLNLTSPGTTPHLHFRVVCISDTGSQLFDMVTSGDQFFKGILSLETSLDTSPFRSGQNTCLEEITTLMELGTSNQRLILADVNPDLVLRFYEQPDPTIPTAFLDRSGHFFTREGKPLAACFPPVGQWASMIGTNRYVMPFDRARAPSCFIQSVKWYCDTNVLKIK